MLVYFEAQDQIPPHLRDKASSAGNGMFLVELASAEELHDISGLKSALEREREARRKAEQEAKRPDKSQAQAAGQATEADDAGQDADSGRIREMVEGRLRKEREEYETRIATLQASNEQLSSQLATKNERLGQVVIDASVTRAIDSLGIKVRPGALDDVLARARGMWTLDQDGNPVALDGKNGDTSDFKAWAAGLYKSASHLFENNAGGGAPMMGGETGPAGRKRISRHDKKAFNENIDGIARGEVGLSD